LKRIHGIILAISFTILLIGCAKPPLTPNGSSIKLISKNNISKKCTVVDIVSGRRNTEQGGASGAIIDVRNKAALLGANTVSVISSSANVYGVVTITAEALNCQ
jgi:hypothetical protein